MAAFRLKKRRYGEKECEELTSLNKMCIGQTGSNPLLGAVSWIYALLMRINIPVRIKIYVQGI